MTPLPIRRAMLACALAAASCASAPEQVERVASTSFDRPGETRMGRYFADHLAQHPGESGFMVVKNSHDAFTLRVGLADVAERSLDLQYYIWESDTTGRLVASKLVKAADRGVRVRVLLDDNNFQGRDFRLGAIDRHPNIEVRVFNPFANRSLHIVDFLTSFSRVNQRMHNKVMIADGTVAVVGGRNIGDHYFGVNTKANFRDLDLAAVGPIVPDVARTFDLYWNSEWAYPISALNRHTWSDADLAALSTDLQDALAAQPYPHPVDDEVDRWIADIDRIAAGLIWARGQVVADVPRLDDPGARVVKDSIIDWLQGTERELLIESAYFVMLDRSVAGLAGAVDRGVKVRVLTNSLASNDVAAAHAGYEKFRKKLLRAGVDIHELRPDAGQNQDWSIAGGRSIAALHTKAMVIDRRSTFVGSYNLDPRSGNINTEVGLIVESPELAARVAEFMDAGVVPGNAYRVSLEDGKLRWTTEVVGGKDAVFTKEPQTSLWKRLVADMIKALPVESQL